MTTSTILRYQILKGEYLIVLVGKKARMRNVMRCAVKLGRGSLVSRISLKRNGKLKISEWEYTPNEVKR